MRAFATGLAATLAGCATAAPERVDAPVPVVAGCEGENDPVLMIVAGTTLDRERMGAYAAALAESGLYPQTGGEYLNSPRPLEVLEGDVGPEDVALVVRFPSLCAQRAFWNSDAYQARIKPMRLNPSAGDYSVVVYPALK